jgi:hypothetical protein
MYGSRRHVTCRHALEPYGLQPRAPTGHSTSRWGVVEVTAPLGGPFATRCRFGISSVPEGLPPIAHSSVIAPD